MKLHERLTAREREFDPELGLYGAKSKSPGYHTRVPDGTWVHQTRDNLALAHELLSSGEPHWIERALAIIRHIVGLQDQNPLSPTYGVWPWLVEEPLDQMDAPDLNWADFLGQTLAQILFDHSALLPDSLLALIKESLGHAAHSIFRRNIGAGYSNIAVKGGFVTVAAGEVLDEPRLVDYGRRRLRSVVENHDYHGGFNEYNSPTYLRVILDVCETGLRILRDPQALVDTEQIRRFAWQALAEHFHPATRQLGGPQSRAYSNFLVPDFVSFLGARTGLWETEDDAVPPGPLCPSDLIERFRALPGDPFETRHSYFRREGAHSTVGTTWFTHGACLGSVSHDTIWDQRRPVLGYWLDGQGKPVALHLRMLRDGKSFASGFVWNAQSGPRVLTAAGFITDGGDFHPFRDRPADGIFAIRDLRIRYELIGEGVSARELGDGMFEFAAGAWRAVIHTVPCRFDGREVIWQLTKQEGAAYVDGICPIDGERLDISDPGEVIIASAVEIIPLDQPPNRVAPTISMNSNNTFTADWPVEGENLRIIAPSTSLPKAETHHF